MSFRDQPLHGVAVYNPGLLSKAELIRLFVAREPLLESLLDDLRRETGGTAQHHLLVGRRGMGKTTMLRRLAYAVEDDGALSQTWMALTFPEEQYNVSRPSDFWLNCIDALGDALEDQGRVDRVEALDARVAEIHDLADERRRHDAALDLLVGLAGELQRRLILLVDNVDLVLQRFEQQEAWALREVLSTRPEILLLGATSAPFEAFHAYEAPFYDFFRVHLLGGLDEPQTFDVLRRLSRACDAPDVERLLDTEPARIKTLRVLAGGNPRTIVLLFGLLAQGVEGSVRTDLERLLDHCTPLYKDRFERLSPQQQTIVDALAINWDPMHAGDLARKARMQVQKVSSQLTRLERDGVVEKVRIHPSTKAGFQMAERFFNIWYLMRASRRVRRRLIWLVEFLRMFFGAEELEALGRKQLGGLRHGRLEHHAEYALALADVMEDGPLRRALELDGIRALVEDDRLRRQMREWFDFEEEDAELKPLVERIRLLDEAKRAIMQADVSGLDVTREELWALIGGSLKLSVDSKHVLALGWHDISADDKGSVVAGLSHEVEQAAPALSAELVSLRDALRRGDMASPSDADGARAAIESGASPGLLAVALSLGELSTAEQVTALENALVECRAAGPWLALAGARERRGELQAAVVAAEHAALLNPQWGSSHVGLASLLFRVGRREDAIGVCRTRTDNIHLLALLVGLLVLTGRADEAQELTDALERESPDSIHTTYVLAHTSMVSCRHAESLEHLKRLLALAEADRATGHLLVCSTFLVAAQTGLVGPVRSLLAAHGSTDRWRPLDEALRAIEAGTREVLTQVAPEIRQPAEALLDQYRVELPS